MLKVIENRKALYISQMQEVIKEKLYLIRVIY